MFDPYNPYNGYQTRPMVQSQQLIRVTGLDGARAYQMAQNSVVPLFDANDDIIYIKSTDGAGFPTIRSFRFTPMDDKPVTSEFVTKAEFEAFKEAMTNAKQSVRKSE